MGETKTAARSSAEVDAFTPIAVSIAPEIARWLFGDSGVTTAAAIAHVAELLTGTTDAGAQRAAVERDPDLACRLRVELARIAAQAEADASSHKLDLGGPSETASARAQAFGSSGTGSPISSGAVLVSVVVLVIFGAVMVLIFVRAIPAGSDTIVNVLLGSLAAMATSVVSYWVGSSAGSARKDDRIAQLVSGG